MAAFNADTDANWIAYLAKVNALTGYKRQQVAEEVVRWVCWNLTEGTLDDVDAAGLAAGVTLAIQTIDNTRGF